MPYSLYLYPQGPHREFDQTELAGLLTQIELIAPSATAGNQPLIPGPRLMEHITYLGCSPGLKVGEIDSSISIHYFSNVTGLGGDAIESIRLPRCKHRIEDPSSLLASGPDALWQCAHCDNQGRVAEINWRKSAAFADCFIEISPVFPKEAIPAASFISTLEQFSESKWRWFYSRSINS